ncbi:MAG TPA: linear amide C-N hydrolase [Kofleriaceae bacterium]|nr:linear amide C-N hydrolase [Kofleriaceae bacterium]
MLALVLTCTTFCLSDGSGHLVGKSYDWDMEQGIVMTNPRGLHKRALLLGGGRPAEWDARYASVTFNQYGREMPNGGMNEAGLVVEVMWLDETAAPPADRRPAVGELQWIQMQLDTRATVAEVVRAADKIRVAPIGGKVHYMACDATGACAVFENLAGKMVVTAGDKLTSKVLTNDTYRASAAALAQHQGFGGKKAIPKGAGSLERFVRAAALVARSAAGKPERKKALAVLDSVKNGAYTKWNIVYDPVARRIAFRTRSRPALKEIDLAALATGCKASARMLDMATTARGDVTGKFTAYTFAANKKLVETSLAPMGDRLPPGAAWLVASYPATSRCKTR